MSDWLYWTLGGLFGVAGAALLLWSLFADRSRGRRRCPKCWYDMSHTEGLRCPECGHQAKRTSGLHETRHHWRWALLSVIPLLAAGYLAIQPKVRAQGWPSVLPNTCLILALHMDDNKWAFDQLEKNISVRLARVYGDFLATNLPDVRVMYDWQWRLIAGTCADLVVEDRTTAERLIAMRWLSRACSRLGCERVPSACVALESLLQDPDPTVRQNAAIYAARTDAPERRAAQIGRLIDDSDVSVRMGALSGLGLLANYSEAPLPYLVKALADANPEVRLLAVRALGRMAQFGHASGEAIDTLYRVQQIDPDAAVRSFALQMLMMYDPNYDRWRPLLQAAMADSDEKIRSGAFSALSMIDNRPDSWVDSALNALGDESSLVRREAGMLLLDFSKPADLTGQCDRLRALQSHFDPKIVEIVTSLLESACPQ